MRSSSARIQFENDFPTSEQGILKLRSLYPVLVLVDGEQVGFVQGGCTELFELESGQHTVQIIEHGNSRYSTNIYSPKMEISLDANSEIMLHCVAKSLISRMGQIVWPTCLFLVLTLTAGLSVRYHILPPDSIKNATAICLGLPFLLALFLSKKPGAVFTLKRVY